MRFLIAGLGSIGRRHLRNLVACGERDVLLLRSGKSTLPDGELDGFPAVDDIRTALERRPDAVIVCNPTALHLDVAIPAAEAGCHILLEKPVSHSMERVDVLQRAVRLGGSRLLVGFQFRYHPTLQKVKSMVHAGELGDVSSVRAHWGEYLPDWHPWEDYRASYAARRDLGGGALLTLSHPFDYLCWIFGDVAEARGVVGHGLDLKVEAAAEVSLRFTSEVLAGVHLDYLQRPPDHHLEVVGEEGRLRWNGWTGGLEVCRSPEWVWQHQPAPDGFERNDMFVQEIKHFRAVASGDESPACTLEDGIRVQRIIEAVRDSALRRERT